MSLKQVSYPPFLVTGITLKGDNSLIEFTVDGESKFNYLFHTLIYFFSFCMAL